MNPLHAPSRLAIPLLAWGICVAPAAWSADAAAPFTPPANMVQTWSTLADQTVVGRVRKIELWKKYERFAPCHADANVCQLLAQHLLVLTLDVAKSPEGEVMWLVSIPDDQRPKVGYFVQFTLPTTAKELGAGVYTQDSKLVTPTCRWGKLQAEQAVEGVICDKWNYGQMDYFSTQKAPAQP